MILSMDRYIKINSTTNDWSFNLRSVGININNFYVDRLVFEEFVDIEEDREYYYHDDVTFSIPHTSLQQTKIS